MNSDIISKSILNELEDVVYIADPKTYELYYMNASLNKILGCPSEDQWRRKKCYKILQGLDAPCPFCTNHLLSHDHFYNWEHYNTLLDTYYDIQDKLVIFEGITARLEIGKDISSRKHLENNLTQQLDEQRVLNSCISLLHTAESPDDSINNLLGLVAQFYKAERGYIFTIAPSGVTLDNTHEWCEEGVEPQIQLLQNVDYDIVGHWFKKYKESGEFFIDSLNGELDHDSPEFAILDMQGIQSLVTAPLYNTDGSFMGFIGVDNPTTNMKNTTIIRAVSSFVADFMDKSKQMATLHQISYFDNLTGLQNRHSYSNKIATLQADPPASLGVIYVDINGLKAMNDIHGHKEGDIYIKTLATFLRNLYDDCAFRIGGDEFVMLCSEKEEWCFYDKLGKLTAFINSDALPMAAIGYCWRMEHCNVIEQIETADRQMYKVKEAQYKQYSGQSELFRRKYLVDAKP